MLILFLKSKINSLYIKVDLYSSNLFQFNQICQILDLSAHKIIDKLFSKDPGQYRNHTYMKFLKLYAIICWQQYFGYQCTNLILKISLIHIKIWKKEPSESWWVKFKYMDEVCLLTKLKNSCMYQTTSLTKKLCMCH